MQSNNTWTVSGPDIGKSLQEFISGRMRISKRSAKNHIDARVVRVNGSLVWMAHHTLKSGDCVSVAAAVKSPSAVSQRPKFVKILYENEFCIIADKPRGIITNESDASVETILRMQTGNPDLRASHRLDRDTTGCLILSKNAEAHEAVVGVFKRHKVIKTYNTAVTGLWEAGASTIGLDIDGERALTRIHRISYNKHASYLSVRIETGRTHQIRKHLAMARHPVLGDSRYGFKTTGNPVFARITYPLLHAASIEFENPWSGGTISAFSPLPQDFHRFLTMLGLSAGQR